MNGRWFAVLAVVLTAAVALAAQAQNVNMCIVHCFSTFSPSQNNGSTELRDECLQQCNKSAASTGPHGAMAFGAHTASWGVSYGKPNAGSANSSAMSACLQHGSDCQLVASYTNSCAALATVRAKAKFVAVQAQTLADAKARCDEDLPGAIGQRLPIVGLQLRLGHQLRPPQWRGIGNQMPQ